MRKKINLASKIVQNATVSRCSGHRIGREDLIKAIRISGGIISEIARRFGCPNNRTKIYRAIDKYSLRENLEEEREILLDMAESGIRRAIVNGNERISMLVLTTLGRNRGYGLPSVKTVVL